ncbi:RHS repeat domain-containing protein [Nonomuraea wenchangensis]
MNAASQVRTETSPAGNATSYDYDLAGRPPKITNALGNSLSAPCPARGSLMRAVGPWYGDAAFVSPSTPTSSSPPS